MSTKKSRIFVVLPAYNEENNIKRLIEKLIFYLVDASLDDFLIVVVNDGSKDKTGEILSSLPEDYPVKIITHEVNKGLGKAIQTGLSYVVNNAQDHDILITMDADDSHTPGLIYRMVSTIREGYDVIIASRYRRGSRIYGLSLFREVLSIFASLLLRVLFPTKGVRDFTCGYRAYRVSILRKAFEHYGDGFVNQTGFQVMIDILLKLRKMKFIFGEVPFILRYDLKEGISKMNVKKTIINTLKLLWKHKFNP